MSFYYCLYGQNVITNKALRKITSQQGKALKKSESITVDLLNNVEIGIPSTPDWTSDYPITDENKFNIRIWRNAMWVCLEFPRDHNTVLRFYIRKDGTQIISKKPSSIPDNDVESFLLGPVIGCALRLKGFVCLHASVLSIDGRAFALIGNKGAGKSTTASALLQEGVKLIADDVAVISAQNNHINVIPGYPGVRLMPEPLSLYKPDIDNYELVVSVGDKRFIPLPDGKWKFEEHLQPLSCIYELKARDSSLSSISINNLSPSESLMALSPHSYVPYMISKAQKPKEFSFMAMLSRKIQIKSLQCPDNTQLLASIAKDIINDFKQTQQKNNIETKHYSHNR